MDNGDGVRFACPCYDVTGEAFRKRIEQGITDVKTIQKLTGAGLGCGMCEERMSMVIREAVETAKAERGNPASFPEPLSTQRQDAFPLFRRGENLP